MKKIIALLLALTMVFALCACKEKTTTPPEGGDEAKDAIAFCSDVGTITDQSFNQFCYAGVEAVAKEKGLKYEYYIPSENTTEQRENNVRQAVSDGATIIVCTGYMYGETLTWAATEYPDVKFIAVDVVAGDLGGTVPSNVHLISFKEEQAGYLAGYAAVKDGYTQLGFLGGASVPAVVRFGYGYIQGADAAANEMGVDIGIKYTYGGKFEGDAEITAKMEGWYTNGTQIVFACGGGIYTSAVEAAEQYDGKVIGVDVDQRPKIGDLCITSAMKGLGSAVNSALDAYFGGNWASIGGKSEQLGLAQGDYLGLPTDTDSWGFTTFTVDEYNTVLDGLKDGSITVSNDTENQPEVGSHVTVDYVE